VLDPIDIFIDHPDMPEYVENKLLVISILALIIMIIYGIYRSVENSKIEQGVKKNMKELRKQWRQEEQQNDS